MRAAQSRWIALASGLILSACQSIVPNAIQVNRAISTPVGLSTPSAEFTTTLSSTVVIVISSTATLLPTSQFTPIPSFTPANNQVTETPLIIPDIPVSGTDTPVLVTGMLITEIAISRAIPESEVAEMLQRALMKASLALPAAL